MGVRYRHDFTSQLGRQWRINLHDKNYASTVNEFDAANEGFVLQYGDGASKTIDPILGSRCEVTVQVIESNSALRTFISEVVAAQENVFFIEIQEDTGSGYELYWGGKILNDLIQEPDTWPSEVTLTATDGLASLKDVPFDNAGTLYTGDAQFNELLALLINKTDVQSNIYGVSATDFSLRTAVNWWHNDMGLPSTLKDPLALTRVNQRTWWDEVNTDQDFYAALDSYSVLQNIAQGWFSRVFQSKGKYYFMQVPQHGVNPSAQRDYAINGAGTIVASTTSNADREKAIDQSSIARLYLGTQRYFPALKLVESNYLHNGSNNILPNAVDFDYSAPITFPPSGQKIQTVGTLGGIPKFIFRATIEAKVTNNIEFNTATAADLSGSPDVSAILKAKIKIDDTATQYYLWKTVAGISQWNLSTGSRLDIPIELPPVNSNADGSAATSVTQVDIETPNVPFNFFKCDGTFEITGIAPNVEYTIGGTTYTAAEYGGVDYDVDLIGSVINVAIQYRLTKVELIVKRESSNGVVPAEETLYSSSNSSANDGQPDLKTEDIRFGADVGGLPPGVLEVYDGANWNVNSDEWEYNVTGGGNAFNQLLTDEILALQTVAAPVQEWTVRGVFDFYNTLLLGTDAYAPISATFNAWSDTWSGTYFYVDRDRTDVLSDTPTGGENPNRTIGINSISVQQAVSTKNTFDALNGLAELDGTIEEGATVTSIPVKSLAAGYWKSGDTVTVFNPNSGNSQVFTVNVDTTASDTSISVTSASATETFYPGANIMVTVTDKISNATGPYIKKYADDTVEANTLWQTNKQVQFSNTFNFLTADDGSLYGSAALVRKAFGTIRDIFGLTSGNGWSAGVYNGATYRKAIEAVVDGSGNLIARLYHGANSLIAETTSSALNFSSGKGITFNLGDLLSRYTNDSAGGAWTTVNITITENIRKREIIGTMGMMSVKYTITGITGSGPCGAIYYFGDATLVGTICTGTFYHTSSGGTLKNQGTLQPTVKTATVGSEAIGYMQKNGDSSTLVGTTDMVVGDIVYLQIHGKLA